MFIKELSFRSADERNLNKTLRLVKELHKRIAQREKEQTDRASLVMQAPLKLNRDPRHDFKLRDLQMRPSIGGKKETVRYDAGLTLTGPLIPFRVRFLRMSTVSFSRRGRRNWSSCIQISNMRSSSLAITPSR